MSNPLIDLVEAHLGVDLREPTKRDAKLDWIANGGESIGKPTHFEVNDGKF